MNRHIQELIGVGYVNGVATVISLSDFETSVRILSILLASIYTTVKLYQALRHR